MRAFILLLRTTPPTTTTSSSRTWKGKTSSTVTPRSGAKPRRLATTVDGARMAAAADADSATPAPAFPSAAALAAWLRQRSVPTDAWGGSGGSSSSKTVEDLFGEVQAGESQLFEQEEEGPGGQQRRWRRPLRRVAVVSLTLLSPSSSPSSASASSLSSQRRPLALAEASQVLPDGRVRRRGLLPLSEKMRPEDGGCWRAAARRGVQEELGSVVAAAAAAAAAEAEAEAEGRGAEAEAATGGAAAAAATLPLVSLDESSHTVEQSPLRDAASYPGLPTLYVVHRARGWLCPRAFASVLPAALAAAAAARKREGGVAAGQAAAAAAAAEKGQAPLEFETVEEVRGGGGGGLLRTTWRWVDEAEVGGGGGGWAGGGSG
jgi:hypothetical protein